MANSSEYRAEWYRKNKDKFVKYREEHKEQLAQYRKEYNEKNREKLKEYRVKRYAAGARRYRELLSTLMCVDCGCADMRVLEWHHRVPNEGAGFHVGQYLSGRWERVIRELEKCDLLCANCHRIRHWNW